MANNYFTKYKISSFKLGYSRNLSFIANYFFLTYFIAGGKLKTKTIHIPITDAK